MVVGMGTIAQSSVWLYYNNVYEDVRDLCDYGLLEKDEHGVLNTPYDQIVIRTNVREAVAA